MKLNENDYSNIALEIIKSGEYDGTVEYEKDGETLFVDYSLTLSGDFDCEGQWICDFHIVSILEVTCSSRDEDNLEHDFDESKLVFDDSDFDNFGY